MTPLPLPIVAIPPVGSASSSSAGLWLAFGLGTAIGATLTWIAWRIRARQRADRIAQTIERLGEQVTEEDFGRLQDSLAAPWDRIAVAGRRALRAIAARERAAAVRLQDLEAILYSTASGFIAIDPRHRVLDINPAAAQWLGTDLTKARGRLMQEVARLPELNRFLDDAFGAPDSIERTLQCAGTPPLLLRAMSEPLRDATGRAVGMLVSLQDVTRMHRLETLRSEFVANVSHELRTPITSIKGYVETLLQVGSEDPARVRKFLEIVQRNATRLSSLVEDLLALASLEQVPSSEGHGLEIGPIRAAEIARGVSELLGPPADARRIRVELKVDDSVLVLANTTLAEQALSNLLSNAIRYSPEGSRVTLGVRRVGEMGELSVPTEFRKARN